MKRLIILIITLSIAVSAFAQYRDDGYTTNIQSRFLQPNRGLLGLLNSPNLNMSQSYSMMYSSSSYGSVMQGLYLNNMRYRLSGKMLLDLQLGIMHQPYSSFEGGFNSGQGAAFMGGATLLYRPMKNLSLSIGFSNMPYYNYGICPNMWLYDPYSSFNSPIYSRPKEYSPGFDE